MKCLATPGAHDVNATYVCEKCFEELVRKASSWEVVINEAIKHAIAGLPKAQSER